jgi:hypothetical protein
MDNRQHETISSMQRIGLAFHPHMVWDSDELSDQKGVNGAMIEDYILTVYHSDGNRSLYGHSMVGNEVSCQGLHIAEGN